MEHFDGNTYMGAVLSIKENGDVELIDTYNCSLADITDDYVFDTENDLYRIMADKPIEFSDYNEILNAYHEFLKGE